MEVRVVEKIHVSRHVADIMALPCVFSCHKQADGSYCYLLYAWDELGQYVEAHEGDWICVDADGRWTVERE